MGKEIVSKTTLAKGVTACVVVAASLGIIQIGEYSINSSEGTTASSNKGDMSYTPGTYTASSAGISSDVTVSCTFDESSITSITVDVSGETAGLGADIGDEMIEQFMAAQSSEVDGVSGATITSDALKAALEDCIAQATGSSSGSSDDADSTEEETEEAAETESEAASEAETEPLSEDEAESESAEADDDASVISSGSTVYTPGTYTASAAGIQSDVTVTITVDESSILSITCDVSGETAGIGADISDEIIDQILSAQSSEVDGVSGATITSEAVMAATADALAQASEGAEASEEADVSAEAVETEAETDVTESESDEASAVSADAEGNASSGEYTPGTYTASSAGISSDVTVTCTFDETGLAEITADVSGETAGIGADIGDEMIAKVLEAQSADVDGVSGATITSNAFLAAVADCMEQAGFTGAAPTEEETETETETESETETETEAETEIVTEAEAETEALTEAEAETETESETELESESEAESETESNASSGEYTPGTYTASSAGISSDVTVTCTFDETGLAEITADVSGETAGIGADIGDEMIAKVLEAQSADVDGVSGATITSNAFLAAVADCMEQAGFTGAATAEEETETETEVESETETETETESETEAETESESETETETESESETETETESESETETETESETEMETETESETEVVTEEETETETETEVQTEEDIESEDSESTARFTPGVYTASAEGISSTVTITIIVDEDSILSVGYDLSGETSGIGAEIGPDISRQILNAQSAEVNGISGATITSDAFKEALAECIAQAESTAATADDTDEEDSTEAETDEADSEDKSGLVTTYNAGVYTASAEGISSEVVITVAFDDDSIVSIGYDLSGETAGIGADIGPEISGQILTAQSVDVDGVSGATITSNAIKEAIAACIEQAKN